MKPKVLLTRSLPSSVLARLEAACDVDLFRGGGPVPRAEFLARVAGKEALLSMVTDTVDRAVIDVEVTNVVLGEGGGR